tara:strand:- start:59 stop:484 length:426 start_codon:yes stop_codon:yes gene_type:complete
MMKFRNPFASNIEKLISKEAENALYEKAWDDIENNIIDKGIWTKAYAMSDGDEQKQKSAYIRLIVEHYKDLIKAGEELEVILKNEIKKAEKEQELYRENNSTEVEANNTKASDRKSGIDYLPIIIFCIAIAQLIIYLLMRV